MTADPIPPLLTWLQQLHRMTAQLLVLLEQEGECLRQRNPESLAAVVESKHAVAAQIDRLLAQFPSGDRPLEAVIEQGLQVSSHPEADLLWRQVKDAIGRCRRLNEANGARIALLQEHNQQSLMLLFGQRRRLVGYDPVGRSQMETGERLLGAG